MYWRTYLIVARARIRHTLTAQPAFAKAAGSVRAPVPTIKLNMYVRPTHGE